MSMQNPFQAQNSQQPAESPRDDLPTNISELRLPETTTPGVFQRLRAAGDRLAMLVALTAFGCGGGGGYCTNLGGVSRCTSASSSKVARPCWLIEREDLRTSSSLRSTSSWCSLLG